MHISEGFLSPQMLAAGWAVAGIGVAVGLRRTNVEKIVPVAAMSSAFFLASLINVKIGPSSTHLSLIAPMGLILGWGVFPAVIVALLLQALLFQFGGLLVLGVNTVNFALPALIVYLLFAKPARGANAKISGVASFAAGFFGVILSALGMALFLGFSDTGFLGAAKIVFAANVPLAFIEGAVTLFIVSFLKKTAPDVLTNAVLDKK